MRGGTQEQQQQYLPILGGFVPLASLWGEGGYAALFPSESSARWFIRASRAELVQAEAIVMHAGRLLIHHERAAQVAQRVGLARAGRSFASLPRSGN